MNLVRQKTNYGRGQACVAMITGKRFEEIIAMIGRDGSTRTKDIVGALTKYGYKCRGKLTRVSGKNPIPKLCIGHLVFEVSGKKKGHWVVIVGKKIYDPGQAGIVDFAYYKRCWPNAKAKITSFLEIQEP